LSECQITLLGTGTSVGVPIIGCRCPVCRSSDPKNHRTRAGVLVEAPDGKFVIDTPPELRLQLIREDVDVVRAAVFTHAHADHIYGLDDLRICGFRMDAPVELYCEESVEVSLRRAFYYAFDADIPATHPFALPKFRFRRIDMAPFKLLGTTIQPMRLFHGPLAVLGFRIGTWAYCTDVSEIPDESLVHLEGLDHLVIDALREQPHPSHFSVGQALDVIERVRPARAWLTHISHQLEYEATNRRLPANVELTYDGLRFD